MLPGTGASDEVPQVISGPSDQVFAEFVAAGLWPGVGKAVVQALPTVGIRRPADVTPARLRSLPRTTPKRADRLFTAWIAAGNAYAVAGLLVPQELPVR